MNDIIATPWLVIDADGTAHSQQLFVHMTKGLAADYPSIRGLIQRTEPLYEDYKSRRRSFVPYIKALVAGFFDDRLYAGIRHADYLRACEIAGEACRKRMYVFMRELLLAAGENRYKIAVISGSPKEAVDTLFRPFNVDAVFGTTFTTDANGLLTDESVSEYVSHKHDALDVIEQKFGLIDAAQSVAVGDTASDAKLLERVGFPLAFKPKRELVDLARQQGWPIVVEEPDWHAYLGFNEGKQLWLKGPRDVLPPGIATTLHQRLENAGW